MGMIVTETKVCKKCGVEKEIGQFKLCIHKNGNYRRGKCNDCWREVQKLCLRKYREHSGHKIQAHHRQRYETEPEYKERMKAKDARKYQRKKEYRKAWQIKYRKDNRVKVRECDRNKRLKQEYGIDLKQFRVMLAEQDQKCLICKEHLPTESKANVDHCHKTGVVRGILCHLCNLGLGTFRDRPDLLLEAINYLNTRTPELRVTNETSLET